MLSSTCHVSAVWACPSHVLSSCSFHGHSCLQQTLRSPLWLHLCLWTKAEPSHGLVRWCAGFTLIVGMLPGVTLACVPFFLPGNLGHSFEDSLCQGFFPHVILSANTLLGEKKRPFSQKSARLWCFTCRG